MKKAIADKMPPAISARGYAYMLPHQSLSKAQKSFANINRNTNCFKNRMIAEGNPRPQACKVGKTVIVIAFMNNPDVV